MLIVRFIKEVRHVSINNDNVEKRSAVHEDMATKFAIKTMPPVAMVSCALLYQSLGADYLPQTITIGAFFLSLPMQGLLWLGHRSDQYLPPQLKSW